MVNICQSEKQKKMYTQKGIVMGKPVAVIKSGNFLIK